MKQLLNLLTAMSISVISLGQTTNKVTGTIKDGNKQVVTDAATVSLLFNKDSSLVKAAITDKHGNFVFENIKDGSYLVAASSVGHKDVYTKSFTLSATALTISLDTLQLMLLEKNLTDVIVISKKPFIERKLDKTVINVDAAVTNAGTTAMDVLEKSPGVTVDKDGNISLKGKQGVMIMIDGKPSYLGGAELTNLLRSMSSTNLDQIEIMTNPSAKYDAAGNSGIINIKTKKSKQKGFNGNVTLGYGQGIYAKTNNSLNLNYRNGKFNVFIFQSF